MICVVLAAGYATRLYPLTENFPKPLLKVKEKPILNWLMEDIEQIEEVTSFVIISNHKYVSVFEDWLANQRFQKQVKLIDDGSVDNAHRMGAVKDMAFAISSLKLDDDLLVIAGDNLLDFSFRSFVQYFNEKQATCIMRYDEPEKKVLQACGVIEIDETDRVLHMVEKPQEPVTHYAVPPFYVYKKEDLPYVQKGIDEGCATDAPGSFIAWLCKQRPVYAMQMPGDRYDVGDFASYEAVQQLYPGIFK